MRIAIFLSLCMFFSESLEGQVDLVGHWHLQNDFNDHSGSKLPTNDTDVSLVNDGPTSTLRRSSHFNGVSSVLKVDQIKSLDMGDHPFSIAAWVKPSETSDDVLGDIASHYDSDARTGFVLGLYSHLGVTTSQANSRQLHFGIDRAQIEPEFTDHGRLGNAVYIFSLCVHGGKLYASTCYSGADEKGHVFRFEGGTQWTDLGAPDQCNAISAMAVYQGELYVASSKNRLAGSSLSESENPNSGGRVFRLSSDNKWLDCGRLSEETEAVSSLIEFKGKLYAASLYKPAGFFRFDGGDRWTACPVPEGKRVEATTVFNGGLYATCYDEGSVFRFDGEHWLPVGNIPNATQTYGFAVHQGSLFVSEWPQAHVFRYNKGTQWEDVGKLGSELEAMPLVVYNGKMYGGTLPLAEVYRFDGDKLWSKIGRVDTTPDVKYRRAWSMSVYQGRLFVGALPSGRVLSIEAGRNATWDRQFPVGWHHVAAIRDADRLRLFVDGDQVSESATFATSDFRWSENGFLKIGFGAQDFFQGNLADVRIYRGALSLNDIKSLAQRDK